ncbi:MAG: hypothetical protein DRP47_04200 [Candidatus Zixiibacteriota bacterium]|nr:MAG: hypothetical protein DRP47_04200 [candidate division Zixibacteria bacterium]
MFDLSEQDLEQPADRLGKKGYWPVRAGKYLAEHKYSRAVEICREFLDETPNLISGRLIYAQALYHTGQSDRATEQFHRVLSIDPENLVALKYLGDIKFAAGDEVTALSNYQRVLEIDPGCHGLWSPLKKKSEETTRTMTLHRISETATGDRGKTLRKIPFYTETMGDLYLSQGHARLASRVFRSLIKKNSNPRLEEKLVKAEQQINTKES